MLLAAYPAINAIPVTALAGVMFNVVVHTFEWPSLRIMFFSSLPSSLRDRFGARSEYKARAQRGALELGTAAHKIARVATFGALSLQVRRADALSHAPRTARLLADLAAVITGIVFSALCSAWPGGNARIEPSFEPVPAIARKKGAEMGETSGRAAACAQSVHHPWPAILRLDDAVPRGIRCSSDPKVVTLRFGPNAAVADFSGLEALNVLTKRYERFEKTLKIERFVDASSQRMLRKAGNLLVGEVNQVLEPMETDQLIPTGLGGINVQEGHFTGAIRM